MEGGGPPKKDSLKGRTPRGGCLEGGGSTLPRPSASREEEDPFSKDTSTKSSKKGIHRGDHTRKNFQAVGDLPIPDFCQWLEGDHGGTANF